MSHYFTNDKLESNIKKINVNINDTRFVFNTDNGVFSKNELDYGTYLLIKNVLMKNIHGSVLDLGCGYGPIGIIIGKLTDCKITMININKRAVHLAKMNVKENDLSKALVLVSDGMNGLDSKYDYIISNPPIRVGKGKLYELLKEARDHLYENGEILIVVRKEQGALSLIKYMSVYYNVNVIDKDKGFLIISLK